MALCGVLVDCPRVAEPELVSEIIERMLDRLIQREEEIALRNAEYFSGCAADRWGRWPLAGQHAAYMADGERPPARDVADRSPLGLNQIDHLDLLTRIRQRGLSHCGNVLHREKC